MYAASLKDSVVFPPFRLDLAAGRLCREEEDIPLRPKAFSVLHYLVQRPGRLVSKDELIEANWPDVHVGDEVLKVAIAEIRKALGDPPKASRFIETAHRRGYRFIAKIEQAASERTETLHEPATGTDGSWPSYFDHLWGEAALARFAKRMSWLARQLFEKSGFTDREMTLLTVALQHIAHTLERPRANETNFAPITDAPQETQKTKEPEYLPGQALLDLPALREKLLSVMAYQSVTIGLPNYKDSGAEIALT